MYEDPELDHGWFKKCPAFHTLRSSSNNDNLAEVGLRHALHHSKYRVRSPEHANLFYVPVFEFASYLIGTCENTNHTARMDAAYKALMASPYWKRHRGSDHFFASSAWSVSSSRRRTMASRMMMLAHALKYSIVGRYKSGPFPPLSRVGSCVISIPWESSLTAFREYQPPPPLATSVASPAGSQAIRPAAASSTRPVLMHFAGALDVCCSGQHIRCAMGPLAALTAGTAGPTPGEPLRLLSQSSAPERKQPSSAAACASPDSPSSQVLPRGSATLTHVMPITGLPHVIMRYLVPRNESAWKPCTRRAVQLIQSQRNASSLPPLRPLDSIAVHVADSRFAAPSLHEQTAREMAISVFCLMPAGDNGIRSIM